MEERVESVLTALKELIEIKKELEQKSIKYDDEVNQLKEQVKSANEALADRAREVSILIEKNQKLEDRATEAEELFNKLRNECDKETWEATKLGVKIKTLEEEIVRLNEELENFKKKNDILAYNWFTRFISLFKK